MKEEPKHQPAIMPHLAEWIRRNYEQQPALSGQLRAMSREAIKDMQGALMQTFFGTNGGVGEAGTPLNPTMWQVNDELASGNSIDPDRSPAAEQVTQQKEKEKSHGHSR